jgi:hypothetical protein
MLRGDTRAVEVEATADPSLRFGMTPARWGANFQERRAAYLSMENCVRRVRLTTLAGTAGV